jgi:glycosyltransferase involved in cell wall biosynthesis
MPKVTVLMPVYNGERYLREALESILRQTFSDFEFLIIDDGSRDGTSTILRSYHDERIRVVENGRNLGLIATLNKGLQMARGEYVARMDADDISLPQRLERQLDYMERHREVCVVSSYYYHIDEKYRVFETCRPEPKDFLISFKMHVEGYNPICHPAAMFRTKPVRDAGGYSPEYPHAEDGALWFRLDSLGMKFGVVPRFLFLYRYHPRQITQTRSEEGTRSYFSAYAQHLSCFLGEPLGVEDVTRLSPYWFDDHRIRNSVDVEALLSLKRRIALAFFATRGVQGTGVVLCVADLWKSLLCLRKLDAVPVGHAMRLWRYATDLLHQGLERDGRSRRILCEWLFRVRVARVFLWKLWNKVRRTPRPPRVSHA